MSNYVEIFTVRAMRGGVEEKFSIGKLVGTNKYRVSIDDEVSTAKSIDLTFDTLADCFTAVQTHNAGDGDVPE